MQQGTGYQKTTLKFVQHFPTAFSVAGLVIIFSERCGFSWLTLVLHKNSVSFFICDLIPSLKFEYE